MGEAGEAAVKAAGVEKQQSHIPVASTDTKAKPIEIVKTRPPTSASDESESRKPSETQQNTTSTIKSALVCATGLKTAQGEDTSSSKQTTTTTTTSSMNETKKGTSVSATNHLPTANTGNDRITVDKPKDPLVSRGAVAFDQRERPAAAAATSNISSVKTMGLKGREVPIKSDPSTSLSTDAAKKDSSSHSVSSGSIPLSTASANPRSGHLPSVKKDQGSTATTTQSDNHSRVSLATPAGNSGSIARPGSKPMSSTSYSNQAGMARNEFLVDFSTPISEREEEIRGQRAPLADKYPPYIINSDTSLEGARERLRIALDQTRQLRAAFTDRVYSKYRVCLKPPPQTEEILETLNEDPKGMYKKLQAEMKRTKAEKDLEKRETQKISNEVGASETKDAVNPPTDDKPTTTISLPQNTDSNDPMLYVTSGLSLVVLPESNAFSIDMSMFNERGPFDPSTGQRARGISLASASAGAATLERARKGQAMRAEREKKRSQDQFELSKTSLLPHFHFDSHYCKKPFLANPKSSRAPSTLPCAGSTEKPHSLTRPGSIGSKEKEKLPIPKKGTAVVNQSNLAVNHSAASAKAIRARVQATMSMNTLLSLNPIHEELRNDTNYGASTLAMMECGVGNQGSHTVQYHKNTPHRFKHPFPNSMGGRRKAISGRTDDGNLSALALPNIPTLKERRQYRLITASKRSEAATSHAKLALERTVNQFEESARARPEADSGLPTKKRRISEIEFLHGLSGSSAIGAGPRQTSFTQSIDPVLVLNVMKAVGLVTSSTTVPGSSDDMTKRVSSLFDVLKLKEAGVSVDSGPMFESLDKIRGLEPKLSALQRLSNSNDGNDKINSDPEPSAPKSQPRSDITSIYLRGGGGEVATGPGEGQDKRPKIGPSGIEDNDIGSTSQASQMAGTISARSAETLQNRAITAPTGGFPNVVWDERSQQPRVLFQNPMTSISSGVSPGTNGQQQQQVQAEHYHQTNALQLAHQLRMSRLPNGGRPTAGDLAEYIGGLHPQQVAYDWSGVGAASAAAAVTSSHTLAALGINQHRQTMVPLTVQDHTTALLSREQQNFNAQAAVARQQQHAVVMMGGGTNGTSPYVAQGYPHMAGLLLNHQPSAFMSQNGMQRIPLQTGTKSITPNGVTSRQSQKSAEKDSAEKQTQSDVGLRDKGSSEIEKSRDGVEELQKIQQTLTEQGKKRKFSPVQEDPHTKRKLPRTISTPENTPGPHIKDSRPIIVGQIPLTGQNVNESDPRTSNNIEKSKAAPGLKFFVPQTPDDISDDAVAHVLAGKCHNAISKSVLEFSSEAGYRLVTYITAVGFAVPIPKAMVMHRLKERMSHPFFKTSGPGGLPASSRDVIAAQIMIWLWRNNEECFQRAFGKSGRIDVDTDCKWFVDAAVNKAVSALSDQMSRELSSRTPNSLVSSIISHKSKYVPAKGAQGPESENMRASATKVDLLASLCVSKALNMSFALNDTMDKLLPTFHDQTEYLHEARKCALYCKSQERALLACIVSRKATMSFSFSHSYVSAMVRAGEALGHGSLFEAVQNEKYRVSTMIPYDVFTDESYAWEDPCRPALGFSEGLSGDEMMRRAHARAMIQKSLKKLQERHHIRGGTPVAGAYTDSALSSSSSTARSGSTTPRGTAQRRRSLSDAPFQQGSGSAAATSTSLYDPKHTCPALQWKTEDVDNSPYGRRNKNTKARSLSVTQGAAVNRLSGKGGRGLPRQNLARKNCPQTNLSTVPADEGLELKGPPKSTREISWSDVAGIFQQVQLSGTIREKQESENKKLSAKDRTIFAPVVRKVDFQPHPSSDDSSDEEDLSDQAVLARHQVVLNEMKEKLTAIQQSRNKAQDRRKSRDKSHK